MALTWCVRRLDDFHIFAELKSKDIDAMKVFAHYESRDNIEFRWRTLLQFGSSWNVLGSVVMKNPGSARPIDQVKEGFCINELRKLDSKEEWYEFKPDSTMHCIERLFREYCRQQSIVFEGIVQVFNLMNVRDPNLANAIEKVKTANRNHLFSTEDDINHLASPIYIGWGQLGQTPLFKDNAVKIFNATLKKEGTAYLDDDFQKNPFYHPQYLMGRGKNTPKSIYLLNAFCQNTKNPECDIQALPSFTFSAQYVFKTVVELLEQSFKVTEKRNNVWRFVLDGNYSLSVTRSNGGYIGIRHVSNGFDERNDNAVLDLLDKYGFSNTNNWLGTKSFKEYGYDDGISSAIVKECNELREELTALFNTGK